MNIVTSEVVLVNKLDEIVGTSEKLLAHEKGLLHRGVSVIIINSKNEMLLQRRAANKYHSAGLWTNAACTHPYLNETPESAASRRLKEEMGIECSLTFAFKFIYNAALDNGMIEHELDYVYYGFSDDIPLLNKEEAADYKYLNISTIQSEIEHNADIYTVWFKILLPEILKILTRK